METKTAHIDELISTFLAEGLEADVLEELKAWIAESEENRVHFMKCQEIWFSAVQEQEGKYYDQEKAFELFEKRVEKQKAEKRKARIPVWRGLYKYAVAILLFGFISYFSYQKGENSLRNALAEIEVEAPSGSQTRLHLPDGTTVLLNSDSRITYAQDFGVNSREVTLQGEGYFEVQKNPEKPFIVHVDDINVKVLGTVFNVRSYPEDSEIEVSLIKGKVNVFSASETRDNVILAPDEQLTYDKRSGKMNHHHVDALQTSQWTTGRLSFVNASVPEIMKAIERKYDVRIVIHSKYLDKEVFSGSISPKLTVEEILDYMDVDNKYSWSRSGNVITITDKSIK